MLGASDTFVRQPDDYFPRFEFSIFQVKKTEYISQGELNEIVTVVITFVMKEDTTKTNEENAETLFLALEDAQAKVRLLMWNKATNGLSSYGFQQFLGSCDIVTEQNFMNGISLFFFDVNCLYTNCDTKAYL
jgi:hypothetical protein